MLEKARRAPALIMAESGVQAKPLGLGHAVGCVEGSLLPDEDAIAVLLPDHLVPRPGVLETTSKVRVKGMVEKPKPEDAPSLVAAAGRYVLDRAIFEALRRVPRGEGGEIQLTDAIALLIEEGHPVHVVVHRGSRHDLGN